MKTILSIVALISLSLLSITSYAEITTDKFQVLIPPNVATSTAAYGVIINNSDHADTLINISSEQARVMLHKTEITSGMARMMQQPNMVLEAQSQLILQPMSYHLMLINLLQGPYQQGDDITIVLEFENAGEVSISVPFVRLWQE